MAAPLYSPPGNSVLPGTVPAPTYTGPINNSINNTPQGDALVNSNQQQAAKMGIQIPGASPREDLLPGTASNITGQAAPTPQTTQPSQNTQTQTDPVKQQLEQSQAEYQLHAQQAIDTITGIQNGSIPLSPGEQAQIDGLRAQFQQMISDQEKVNKSSQGLANVRGYQKGAAEYDPTFQVKTIGAIITAGAAKISDLQTKEASAVAALTQSFRDNDIKGVQDAWKIYQDASKNRQDALQKTVDDTAKAIKEAQDAKIAADKAYYDTVTKPINEAVSDAAKNGAPPAVLAAMRNGQDVGAAINASAGYLQNATGDLGEYLAYKRQSDATGKVAASYDDWLQAKKASDAAQKSSEAYSSAYGAALGKAAGEKAAGVSALKPLTEMQAKDLTYAIRGQQSDAVLNNLQGAIISMDANVFAAQKLANNFDITNKYVSNDVRAYLQARHDFTAATLRRESGASIAPSEYATADLIYIPRPDDDPQTLQQKAQAREAFIESTKQNVPDYDTRTSRLPSSLLNQSEDVAEQTLKMYKDSHPEVATQMGQQAATMESTLGRAISATEFLQAFPEYK